MISAIWLVQSGLGNVVNIIGLVQYGKIRRSKTRRENPGIRTQPAEKRENWESRNM